MNRRRVLRLSLFQFALPRGERRKIAWLEAHVCSVSIRAPAWGATSSSKRPPMLGNVSIRAPAWGATYPPVIHRPQVARFNSRSRVGSDKAKPTGGRPSGVSIRAPAWGATRGGTIHLEQIKVSIRAPAWGATIIDDSVESLKKFQFALPRGERPPLCLPPADHRRFQFALPRGERLT